VPGLRPPAAARRNTRQAAGEGAWVRYDPRSQRAQVVRANAARAGSRAVTSVAGSPGRAKPRRDQIRPERIFGRDLRERVEDTTVYPFSAMCKIFVTFPSGAVYTTSGTMVSPRHVLTSGHTVYNHDEGGWPVEILVTPGLDGDYAPYGTVEAVDWMAFDGWVRNANFDHDMGIITVGEDIGDETGWLGFSYVSSLRNSTLNLVGYPTDLEGGLAQYLDYGRSLGKSAYEVYYRLDTYEGTSGAGVYEILRSGRYIVAVNSWETARTNGGCRVTRQKFNQMRALINDDLGP